MKTTSVTLMNLLRRFRAGLTGLDWPTMAQRTPMKKFSFAILTLMGSLAVPVVSKADPLLVGDISTSVRARFNNSDPESADGSTKALATSSQSYLASQTRGDYFMSTTGATQISNDDGADVAKISFTAAANVSAKSEETDLALASSFLSANFSVTAPVTYLIQGDFKGEITGGIISAQSSTSLVNETSPAAFSYEEEERSDSTGVFHFATNRANDGVADGFTTVGALTGVLMPGFDYYLFQGYDVQEGSSTTDVSAFGLGNYSITFTRLTDDGSGDGDGTGGGGGGGGTSTVPDGGSSAGLVSLSMVLLAVVRRRC